MADERKIVIELKAVGGTDGSDDEALKDDDKTAKKRNKAIKSLVKQVGDWEIREITTEAFYQFGKYTSLSENYKATVMLDNIQATIGKTKSLVSSMMGTAMLGAMIGGPVGAVAGAFLGAAMDVTSEALDLRRQYDQQNIQLAMGDRTSAYARSRLGLIDNGRGTQN